jgi:hypothetical protein
MIETIKSREIAAKAALNNPTRDPIKNLCMMALSYVKEHGLDESKFEKLKESGQANAAAWVTKN